MATKAYPNAHHWIAVRYKRDVELGRDFALLGTQLGLTQEQALAEYKRIGDNGNVAAIAIVRPGELKNWRPRKERLDAYLKGF